MNTRNYEAQEMHTEHNECQNMRKLNEKIQRIINHTGYTGEASTRRCPMKKEKRKNKQNDDKPTKSKETQNKACQFYNLDYSERAIDNSRILRFRVVTALNTKRLRPQFVIAAGSTQSQGDLSLRDLVWHPDKSESKAPDPLPPITLATILSKLSIRRVIRVGRLRLSLAEETEKEEELENVALQIILTARFCKDSSTRSFSKVVPKSRVEQYSIFG